METRSNNRLIDLKKVVEGGQQENMELLQALLEKNEKNRSQEPHSFVQRFKPGIIYSVELNGQIYNLELTQELQFRPSKKDESIGRYEIVEAIPIIANEKVKIFSHLGILKIEKNLDGTNKLICKDYSHKKRNKKGEIKNRLTKEIGPFSQKEIDEFMDLFENYWRWFEHAGIKSFQVTVDPEDNTKSTFLLRITMRNFSPTTIESFDEMGLVSERILLNIMANMCFALQFDVHDLDLSHCDVKPGNFTILMPDDPNDEMEVRMIDFDDILEKDYAGEPCVFLSQKNEELKKYTSNSQDRRQFIDAHLPDGVNYGYFLNETINGIQFVFLNRRQNSMSVINANEAKINPEEIMAIINRGDASRKLSAKEVREIITTLQIPEHNILPIIPYKGTDIYLAPELKPNHGSATIPITQQADVFALGIALMRVYTRKPVTRYNLQDELDALPESPLKDLFIEATHPDPEQRPSAGELGMRLQKMSLSVDGKIIAEPLTNEDRDYLANKKQAMQDLISQRKQHAKKRKANQEAERWMLEKGEKKREKKSISNVALHLLKNSVISLNELSQSVKEIGQSGKGILQELVSPRSKTATPDVTPVTSPRTQQVTPVTSPRIQQVTPVTSPRLPHEQSKTPPIASVETPVTSPRKDSSKKHHPLSVSLLNLSKISKSSTPRRKGSHLGESAFSPRDEKPIESPLSKRKVLGLVTDAEVDDIRKAQYIKREEKIPGKTDIHILARTTTQTDSIRQEPGSTIEEELKQVEPAKEQKKSMEISIDSNKKMEEAIAEQEATRDESITDFTEEGEQQSKEEEKSETKVKKSKWAGIPKKLSEKMSEVSGHFLKQIGSKKEEKEEKSIEKSKKKRFTFKRKDKYDQE